MSKRLIGGALLFGLTISAHAQTYSRTDTIAYEDNLSRWVIGQVKSSTNVDSGLVESRTVFDSVSALPLEIYAFEKLQTRLAYNADGTLASMKDGRDNATTLSGWKRGIPQTILNADNTSRSAYVNDDGWIEWVADENGYTTNYDYDAMGRLSGVTYPAEDTVLWTPKSREFKALTATDWKPPGVFAGQWREYVAQGNYAKLTYFDALWRPVLVHEYDSGNVPGTLRSRAFAYDTAGRVAFQSYPSSDLIPAAVGTWTFYDALARVKSVKQDSEWGQLTTTLEHLPGFKTKVTNPRKQSMTVSYMAYDQPTTDWPVAIVHPEGAFTDITRDVFGKPTSLTRRNADNTQRVTRSYAYSAHQKLCRVQEPETGVTFMDYDAASNLAWSAAGYVNTQVMGCADPSWVGARRVDRSYDARNRLTSLVFPDGLGNQSWRYTPDGLPATINTNNSNGGDLVVNAYSYNKRRLLTGESVQQPDYTWALGYGYNANGHLSTVTHPGSEALSFAPNALGQATQAVSQLGTYATGASYYPNGALKQFTYGNGIVHTMIQNARQLPQRSTSSNSVLNDVYNYDANGNVESVIDELVGAGNWSARSRWMTYDGLDRLTGAGAGMFGGTDNWHRFKYDTLDNLKSWKLAGVKDYAYYYEPNSHRLTNIQDSSGASIVGFDYDPQGNLANKNGQVYAFDYGNRLRYVTGKESYRYDGYGRRASAFSPWPEHVEIRSMYGQDGVLRYQRDFRKNKVFNYVYLAGSLVATRETPIGTASNAFRYQHTDALGSPVAVTNESGQVVERTQWEPFGAAIGKTVDGVGYTGHVMDGATGLTYMQQRYYDPTIGRFLSVDPVAVRPIGDNFNRYWYANNNPYKFTDPDGRDVVCSETKCTVNSKSKIGEIVDWGTVGLIYMTRLIQNAVDNIRQQSTSGDGETVSGEEAAPTPGANFPDRPLPRGKNGEPVAEEGAAGPHTQLGQKEGRNGKYPQAREFDADGKPVKDIDFTDHGRPDKHSNPHEHPYEPNPTGGTPRRGEPRELSNGVSKST